MTSSQESSARPPASDRYTAIESLAGVFHPHAIEIQDFAHYALVIDLRSRSEYDDDHLPGAVQLNAVDWVFVPSSPAELPAELAAAVAKVRLDQAILVYCGRGGLASTPVAQALRWRGWTVDVLPGGWINYRRWVMAGLEVLPRLLPLRIIACTLGSETARVLQALRSNGHQVLDLEALARVRRFALAAPVQPAQAWFDSQLLQALRGFDPGAPVWIGDIDDGLGTITLPGALNDAIAIAPVASLQADLPARVQAWAEDEPQCADPRALVRALAALDPVPAATLVAQWRHLAADGLGSSVLASLLGDHLDPNYLTLRASRPARQHALSPLVANSLAPGPLAEAVRQWMPLPIEAPAATPATAPRAAT